MVMKLPHVNGERPLRRPEMGKIDSLFLRNLFLDKIVIRGFEEDDKKDPDPKDQGSEDQNDEETDGDDEEEEDDDGGKEDNTALKSALKKEREARRKLEKENKKLARTKKSLEDKDATELDRAKNEATENKTKAERLAAKLKQTALDNAIQKKAMNMKFVDLDDALRLVDRELIDVEQDEDEPDDIAIDEKSVEDALKALVTKKPHLVGEQKPPASGSKFGGGKNGNKEPDPDQVLIEKYPALRRG
jgi:hypothetical protein